MKRWLTGGVLVLVAVAVFLLRKPGSGAGEMSPRSVSTHREERPDAERRALQAVADHDREGFVRAFEGVARASPDAAELLMGKAGYFRADALDCLAREWAAKDAAAAHDWAAGLSDPSDCERALDDVYFKVAEADPKAALTMASGDQASDAKGTLRNLAQQWAAKDFEGAGAWVAGLPGGPERDEICGRMAMARATSEPAQAARWLVANIPEGPAQDEAVISVLYQWLNHDPAAAAEWVGQFPDSDLKARAEREIENRK